MNKFYHHYSTAKALIPVVYPVTLEANHTIHKIFAGLHLPAFLTEIVVIIIEIVSFTAGALSNGVVSPAILNSLHTQTGKNTYVTFTVGFFLTFNLLGRIPILLPVVIPLSIVTGIAVGLLGVITGVLCDSHI